MQSIKLNIDRFINRYLLIVADFNVNYSTGRYRRCGDCGHFMHGHRRCWQQFSRWWRWRITIGWASCWCWTCAYRTICLMEIFENNEIIQFMKIMKRKKNKTKIILKMKGWRMGSLTWQRCWGCLFECSYWRWCSRWCEIFFRFGLFRYFILFQSQ